MKKGQLMLMKKAAITACVVIICIFSGCNRNAEEEEPPVLTRSFDDVLAIQATAQGRYAAAIEHIESAELNMQIDNGVYVVHFSDHIVTGYIRSKLEAAGLDFSDTPPEYSVDLDGWHEFTLSLFDEEIRVGASHISYVVNNTPDFSEGGGNLANEVTRKFAEEHKHITVGVFFNPDERVLSDLEVLQALGFDPMSEDFDHEEYEANFNHEEYEALHGEMLAERKEMGRQALIEHLNVQAQEFIDRLYVKGILPSGYLPDSGIRVTLNGVPIDFHVSPEIIDGRTMVPMRVIFEAMGFEVLWEPGFISAYTEAKFIEFRVGSNEMNLFQFGTHRSIELDVPSQIVNGRIFVPVRAIAEATGAEVLWDPFDQTIIIYTQ
ncbi:MAG: copper amine oxidase N-terminal domain-containing protein [Defluviitaleaceae bacterium]|nr:copper amine oxidase N-terminal domain-containing protein [Defluviitaleaceae bacterium]